jgi:hypothetical protein
MQITKMRLHTCTMFFSGTWIIYCMTLLAQKYIWSPLSTSLHHLLSWFWVSDHIRVAIEIFPGRSLKRCRAAVETVEEMLRLEVSGCATGRHQIGRSTWEEISIFFWDQVAETQKPIYIHIYCEMYKYPPHRPTLNPVTCHHPFR